MRSRAIRRPLITALMTTLLASLSFVAVRSSQPASATTPAFDHIFVVMEENRAYNQVIGQPSAPYLNGLASNNSLASNYYGVIHPSVNNYLAFASGQTYSNISDGCTPGGSCSTSAPNITDGIERSGRTWKGYFEDMPSPGFDSYSSGQYVARHNPFVYFNQIRTNPPRNNLMVPYGQLATDLQSTVTTPNFVWITPNLCNDMHDCSVATGDTWLQNQLPAIFASPSWKTQRDLLMITWDEDDFTSVNQVPWIGVLSPSAGRLTSSTRYDHYSALRTIESAWGIPPMAAGDTGASPMDDLLGVTAPAGGPPSTTPPTPGPNATPPPPPAGDPPAGGPASCSLSTPLRATFYYPWFPMNWSQNGINPASHYQPWLGYYDNSYPVLRSQIAAMQYAHIRAAIASWWGQGSFEDQQIPALLSAAAGSGGNPICWTLYYEPAISGGSDQIASDLAYIANRYANDPSYLHVNGKPVLFVYSRAESTASDVQTWVSTNAGQFYLNLQVFGGYRSVTPQPDSWHQYGPAVDVDHQAGFSYSISPGYWKYDAGSPRLVRDPSQWATDVANMVGSKEPWQLITTWNEWGEGTAVEDSTAWHSSDTGQSQYLEALHNLPS